MKRPGRSWTGGAFSAEIIEVPKGKGYGLVQRLDQTDFDYHLSWAFQLEVDISSLYQVLPFMFTLSRNLFEYDTNAKEINANAVATFRVKFDHVAMDNFHAVFTGTS